MKCAIRLNFARKGAVCPDGNPPASRSRDRTPAIAATQPHDQCSTTHVHDQVVAKRAKGSIRSEARTPAGCTSDHSRLNHGTSRDRTLFPSPLPHYYTLLL